MLPFLWVAELVFLRFLKIELTSSEKYLIEETGGIPGRARGRFENRPPGNGKISKSAARQQLCCAVLALMSVRITLPCKQVKV